jgi:CPA1 family monovalent cation:H+ antiporter
LIELAASLPLAYVAFFAADRLGGSGLLAAIVSAVVASGAALDLDEQALHRFWRAVGGLMAALVFLLIGLQVRIDLVARVGWRLLLLVLAVTLSRLLMVVIITRAAHRLWPWRWQAALTWAGLRGALSLALALSIPARVNDRVEVVTLAAGFILVSSAIQALLLRPVFRRLGLAATATMGSS